MPPALLRLRELTVVRNGKPAFQPVSLELCPGETAVIHGDNGAGKTSLYRVLSGGSSDSYRGRINFDRVRLKAADSVAWKRFRSETVFVPEDAPTELLERELLGMGSQASVRHLSFGARLRASVDAALARRARLLVVDEAPDALDALTRQQLLHTLRTQQVERNLGILVLCRDPDSFAELQPKHELELVGVNELEIVSDRLEAFECSPVGLTPRDKPLLSCQSVSMAFDTRGNRWRRTTVAAQALHAISFELGWGQTLAVVGASPSGKTTLALALAGLLQPNLGRVVVRARGATRERVERVQAHSRRVQLCFDDPRSALDPRMTTRQLLEEALHLASGAQGTELDEATRKVLDQVSLTDAAERRPAELSSSEACLLGLARALSQRPAVLLLDNALAALGRPQREAIVNLLRRRSRTAHSSQILFTNDLGFAHEVSDHLAVLYGGTLVEWGPTKQLFERTAHPYARALLSQRDRGRRRLQLLLEGEPPAPTALPSGCVFHPRCPRYEPGTCDRDDPDLRVLDPDREHRVACFRPHR